MLYTLKIDDSSDCRRVQHDSGILLLRHGVLNEFGFDVSESDIGREKHGKPFLSMYPDIHFNITHCRGLAACIIAGCRCGVDAEPVRPCRENVARRILTESERQLLASVAADSRDRTFTSLWTLKEAYAKAVGSGISIMSSVSFSFDGGSIICSDHAFHFKQFFLGEYIISACTAVRSQLPAELILPNIIP